MSKVSWICFEIFCNSSGNRGLTTDNNGQQHKARSKNSRDNRQIFLTETDRQGSITEDSKQQQNKDNRNDSKRQQRMTDDNKQQQEGMTVNNDNNK